MTTIATVFVLWLIAVWGLSRLCLVNPAGWLQLAQYMLGLGVWAVGFWIIIWVTPIPW